MCPQILIGYVSHIINLIAQHTNKSIFIVTLCVEICCCVLSINVYSSLSFPKRKVYRLLVQAHFYQDQVLSTHSTFACSSSFLTSWKPFGRIFFMLTPTRVSMKIDLRGNLCNISSGLTGHLCSNAPLSLVTLFLLLSVYKKPLVDIKVENNADT